MALKKLKQNKGIDPAVVVVTSTNLVRIFGELLSEEVTFEQRPDSCEGVGYVTIWGKNVPGGERASVMTQDRTKLEAYLRSVRRSG